MDFEIYIAKTTSPSVRRKSSDFMYRTQKDLCKVRLYKMGI